MRWYALFVTARLGRTAAMQAHSVDKYINSHLHQTSNAHGWTYLLAERWTHGAGELPRIVPSCTEVVIQMKGHGLVDRAGGGRVERTRGGRGALWICPAGIEEEYIHVAEPLDDCLHLFLPAERFAHWVDMDMGLDARRVQLRYQSVPHDAFVESLGAQVLEELEHPTDVGKILVEGLSLALSAHLVKHYSEHSIAVVTSPAQVKPLESQRLQRVIDFIHAQLGEDIAVTDLATIACMSTAHFTRSFRAATGQAPHAYVLATRLEQAKQKLANPKHKIEDIAWSTGFGSQASFTKAFRRTTGLTPGQYRLQQR